MCKTLSLKKKVFYEKVYLHRVNQSLRKKSLDLFNENYSKKTQIKWQKLRSISNNLLFEIVNNFSRNNFFWFTFFENCTENQHR